MNKTANFVHFMGRKWGKCLLIFFSVEIINKSIIANDKPLLIFSNHQGILDIFLVVGYINMQFRYTAKESLFKIPIFGMMMKLAEYIPINRSNAKSAVKSLDMAKIVIDDGKSVLIFIEGTWSKPDGKLLRFKRGGFHLANDLLIPVLPVTIVGVNKALPGDTNKIKSRKIKLVIDNIIQPEAYKDLSEEEFQEKIRNIMQNNLDTY